MVYLQRLLFGIKSKLIPLKLLIFSNAIANGTLITFWSVHMRDIGINIQHAAIISSLFPIGGTLGPFIAGLTADKLGSYKRVAMFFALLWAISRLLLIFIPTAPSPNNSITSMNSFNFSCSSKFGLIIQRKTNQCHNCHLDGQYYQELSLKLKHCETICPANIRFQRLTEVCFQSEDGNHCHVFSNLYNKSILIHKAKLMKWNNNLTDEFNRLQILNFTNNGLQYKDIKCDVFHLGCSVICNIELIHNCTCQCNQDNHFGLTFWPYLSLRFCDYLSFASVMSIIKSTTVVMAKQYGSDFGKQYAFNYVPKVLIPPLTGFMIDHYSSKDGNGKMDYSPAFIFSSIILFLNCFILSKLALVEPEPPKNIIKNILQGLKRFKLLFVIIVQTILGIFWGAQDFFLYWFLADLGASRFLLGLTVSIGVGPTFLAVYNLKSLIEGLGIINILTIAFFFNCIRLFAYSIIYNPYWALIYELLAGMTPHVVTAANNIFLGNDAPKGVLATYQAVCGILFYNVGRISGANIVSILEYKFGHRETLRILGYGALICGLLTPLFYALGKKLFEKQRKIPVSLWPINRNKI